MTHDPPGTPSAAAADSPPRAKPRLWLWFVVGFLIVSFGLLLFVRTTALHPSGRFMVTVWLWQWYLFEFGEIARGLAGPRLLGPGNRDPAAAIVAALQHVLLAIGAGVASMAVGWLVHRLRGLR